MRRVLTVALVALGCVAGLALWGAAIFAVWAALALTNLH